MVKVVFEDRVDILNDFLYNMEGVCLFFFPDLELHKSPLVGKEKMQHCPGEKLYILSDSRKSFEKLCLVFQKKKEKPPDGLLI